LILSQQTAHHNKSNHDYRDRLVEVRGMLSVVVGPHNVEHHLSREAIYAIQFPKRPSVKAMPIELLLSQRYSPA